MNDSFGESPEGATKEFFEMDILLHYIPPKLEYFSKKQVESELFADAIGALP